MQGMIFLYSILLVVGIGLLIWLHSDSGKRFLSDEY